MKRIIDGVTYNTDTSTVVAKTEWEDDGRFTGTATENEGTLYQTRGGAFFVHIARTHEVRDDDSGKCERKTRHEFEPLTLEAAQKWILDGDVEIIHNPFDDPPEAAAESEQGATIYIRVPASLKQRVDKAAADGKLSGNAWAMKCVERCLEEKDAWDFPELVRVWHIARGLAAVWEGDAVGADVELDKWKLKTAIKALEEIGDEIDRAGKRLLNDEDWAVSGDQLLIEAVNREFPPYPADEPSPPRRRF